MPCLLRNIFAPAGREYSRPSSRGAGRARSDCWGERGEMTDVELRGEQPTWTSHQSSLYSLHYQLALKSNAHRTR
jgi:hypothetical protein